jgi:hypothetical protein
MYMVERDEEGPDFKTNDEVDGKKAGLAPG